MRSSGAIAPEPVTSPALPLAPPIDPDLHSALQRSLGHGIRLDRELGGGGMSQVFLATDLSLDRQVVVKVLPAELSAAASVDRFRREIQLVAKLQHPHVVPILSAGDAEGTLYYVMPFLTGETLRARLAREGPFKVAETIRILRETLDALAFAHAHGVIHRDIKPENILLSASHAVVADFGVSKALKDSGALTSAGMTVGTPAYMAPEQAAADPATDHRADLYAVAVVAYEMLTGAPPFGGTSAQVIRSQFADAPVPLKQRRSDVPDSLADLVMRALEKDPALRPQTADEMVAVLDSVITPLGGETSAAIVAREAPAGTRAANHRTRWRTSAIAATLVTMLVGAGAWLALRPTVIASAQSMAITPFSVADGDTALVRLGQNLVTTMSANLDGIGEIRVADPMAVLSNAHSLGPLLSVEAAVSLARKLGVRGAVVGSLTRAGTNVRADLSMYDVDAPATPLFRVSRTMPGDGIAALTDSLTWALLREVWSKGQAPTTYVSSISTRSPVSLREYLEGERLFAGGQFDASADAFERAIAADTTFWFAYHRYFLARTWYGGASDTTLTHRLQRHASELPERERLLLLARDTSTTITSHARQLTEINGRFPDYAPAIQAYGELMLHYASLAGYDAREAVAPFDRLAMLMPSEVAIANHWLAACVTAGDLACLARARAHYENLVAQDSAPVNLMRSQSRVLRAALVPLKALEMDSLVRVIRTDGFIGETGALLMNVGPLLARRPDLVNGVDRTLDRLIDAPDAVGQQARALKAVLAIARGDVNGIDSLRATASTLPSDRVRQIDDYSANQSQLLLEMQGLREPVAATANEALAILSRPGVTPSQRAEGHWIAGVNALWRGDSSMLRAQMAALATDENVNSRILLRSLHALQLGRGGNHSAAAESLLVIEREHGERNQGGMFHTAIAGNRIIAAEWLANAGRFGPADSLLRYQSAFVNTSAHSAAVNATYAAARLQRSRVAEEMGRNTEAIDHARIFLALFDRAGPAGAARVKEARDRLTRLGGSFDGLPVMEVKR